MSIDKFRLYELAQSKQNRLMEKENSQTKDVLSELNKITEQLKLITENLTPKINTYNYQGMEIKTKEEKLN